MSDWNPATRTAFRFAFVYLGLYSLVSHLIFYMFVLPGTLPGQGPGTLWPLFDLTSWVAVHVFGITAPRTDQRIDFVGGGRGLAELERLVTSGEMAAAFALYPTQMRDLMAVADAGAVMPPKSTWFEPKLADGMVSHVLD